MQIAESVSKQPYYKTFKCVKQNNRYTPYQIDTMCSLACRFFRYQQRCVHWLRDQRRRAKTRGVIVNMDVGLGKTLVVLKHAQQYGWNTLYLCPPNVVTHIVREITKHFGPQIRVLVASEWPLSFLGFRDPQPQIVIMSYYTVARLKEEDVIRYNHCFNTCIVDEIQEASTKPGVQRAIKNWFAAKFFIGMTAAAKVAIADLLRFIGAKSYKNNFVFRQIPHFQFVQEYITMTPTTKKRYDLIKQTILHGKQSGLKKHQLREKAAELLSWDKMQRALELLLRIPLHYKTIIVSDYCSILRALAMALPSNQYILLDTKINGQEERQRLLDRFETSDRIRFLLASFDIVYVGINLGFADFLFLLEPPYKLSKKDQLLGRLRRSGQRPKNVVVQEIVEFIVKNSCDEQLYLSNQIQNSNPSNLSSRSEEEDEDAAEEYKHDDVVVLCSSSHSRKV